jgi:hypothetical protein
MRIEAHQAAIAQRNRASGVEEPRIHPRPSRGIPCVLRALRFLLPWP